MVTNPARGCACAEKRQGSVRCTGGGGCLGGVHFGCRLGGLGRGGGVKLILVAASCQVRPLRACKPQHARAGMSAYSIRHSGESAQNHVHVKWAARGEIQLLV